MAIGRMGRRTEDVPRELEKREMERRKRERKASMAGGCCFASLRGDVEVIEGKRKRQKTLVSSFIPSSTAPLAFPST
jgi:hypothetical protein